ncbi:hypothetical protein V9T40_007990 [Parthenolecanium corni]|uniref:Uncharacterized protein n=1 Tax=Parthenolecanium corni TaxID=536013 RepID=A0AAN9TT46_9HEMI
MSQFSAGCLIFQLAVSFFVQLFEFSAGFVSFFGWMSQFSAGCLISCPAGLIFVFLSHFSAGCLNFRLDV